MRRTKSILILTLLSVLFFGFTQSNRLPVGWFKNGSVPDSYKTGIDSVVYNHGKQSLFMESIVENIDGFITVMQVCSARDYLGKKIKMTGFIKSENVADWAGMWLRVDPATQGESLGFDNMQDRPVVGTTEWTKYEIVLDVPAESGRLNFGPLMSGTGKVWFDNVSFEIVGDLDQTVPKDLITDQFPPKPVNLDFEE